MSKSELGSGLLFFFLKVLFCLFVRESKSKHKQGEQ